MIGRRTLLSVAAALPVGAAAFAATSPVAQTRTGKVRGVTDQGIQVFKGIPYGDDTRARRFRPALPAKKWDGIRDALSYGPASPQSRDPGPTSEDCLYLNVWTPSVADKKRRPVMVYFHGGEFSNGSGSDPIYDGVNLCRHGDVVVVTVNHRLAVLGHLFLTKLAGPDFAVSGNVGILDLVLALQWVRDNIANFGGDPGCVTVFGQSGGGAKIATLMAMPAAKGLFHRAITMSGQQVTASSPNAATVRTLAFLDKLKVPKERAADVASLPLDQLIAAMATPDPTVPRSHLYWGPVLDEAALLRHPFYPDAPEQSHNIPMMIGNTLDETRFFFRNDASVFALTWDTLPARLAIELRVDIDADMVLAEYRKLYPAANPVEIYFAATTAGRSWRGALIEAEMRAISGAPVFMYQLNWRSPIDGGIYGASHTLDIPLAFRNTAQSNSLSGNSTDARAVSEQISNAFLSFARTGNPNHTGIPAWTPYELNTRQTMLFNIPPELASDPRGDERRLFAKVPFIQKGTF
ncbi:MAG: carboxylesterase/lipase family protein [Rhodospirillaceae bacterium]|nr:carboxylesterase/lipase family protein [Rhodospirillaceae bacterium]